MISFYIFSLRAPWKFMFFLVVSTQKYLNMRVLFQKNANILYILNVGKFLQSSSSRNDCYIMTLKTKMLSCPRYIPTLFDVTAMRKWQAEWMTFLMICCKYFYVETILMWRLRDQNKWKAFARSVRSVNKHELIPSTQV